MVPPDGNPSWQEVAASNRERIAALERENERTRNALHDLRGDAQASHYLIERVTALGAEMRELSARVESVSRHAMNRPTQSGLALLGQYLALAVAVLALVVAATH
jgi:hypothetical protein